MTFNPKINYLLIVIILLPSITFIVLLLTVPKIVFGLITVMIGISISMLCLEIIINVISKRIKMKNEQFILDSIKRNGLLLGSASTKNEIIHYYKVHSKYAIMHCDGNNKAITELEFCKQLNQYQKELLSRPSAA